MPSRGWDVIAGVRNERDAEAVTALNPQRISSVILDVTDSGQIAALDESLPERLDAIVNNAGIVVSGPMETVSTEEWRKQLEVNVIGQLAVTKAVLPRLRESRGRVVFISSVNGRLSMSLIGAYCASKFALEAAPTRCEWNCGRGALASRSSNPRRPTPICGERPTIWSNEAEATLTTDQRDLYARHIVGMKKMIPLAEDCRSAPRRCAAVVEEALTARRPRARYASWASGPTAGGVDDEHACLGRVTGCCDG